MVSGQVPLNRDVFSPAVSESKFSRLKGRPRIRRPRRNKDRGVPQRKQLYWMEYVLSQLEWFMVNICCRRVVVMP